MRLIHRLALLFLLLAASAAAAEHQTALDRYIAEPDSHFKWELIKTLPGDGFTVYVLDMTSQSWRSPSEVDRTLWRHWVTVVKPTEVTTATGLLFITGGANDGKPRHPPIPHSPAWRLVRSQWSQN